MDGLLSVHDLADANPDASLCDGSLEALIFMDTLCHCEGPHSQYCAGSHYTTDTMHPAIVKVPTPNILQAASTPLIPSVVYEGEVPCYYSGRGGLVSVV